MEDDKKKKKNKNNKKKKNKQQSKAADDTTSSNAGETSSVGTVSEQDIVIDDKPPLTANGCAAVDSEKQTWLQEQARLRDMVKHLLHEKDSYIQTQAHLEMRIKQLQTQNHSCLQKEVSLEQRFGQLSQEKAASNFEEKNLLEKIQHVEEEKLSLVQQENLSKEMIATLNNENARLKMQVLELEGARNSLSQENNRLLDNMSTLQSRIQHIEMDLSTAVPPAGAQKDVSENENLDSEMEGLYTLIGKLMTENAELVEKVNELSVELGQRAAVPDVTSVDVPDYSIADPVSRSTEDIQEDFSLPKKSATVSIVDERMVTDEMISDDANVVRHSSETTVSGEIVQIPLDENESQDLEAQAYVNSGEENVPLADAPLIGAPFRLISFVANYVSGADLVDKGASNSLQ